MERILKIIKCPDPLMWYADKVGETVPFIKEISDDEYLSIEPAGYSNIVKKDDAIIIDIKDKQN